MHGRFNTKVAPSTRAFEPTTKNLAVVLGAIGLIVTIVLFARQGGWHDLKIYMDAVRLYEHGGDAYGFRPDGGRFFLYTPLVLRFFALFDGFLGWVLVAWYAATLLLLLKSEMRPVAIGIVVAAAGMIFVRNRFCQAVHTGNVAVFLHLALIFLWLHYGRHGRVAVFYVAVFAASVIKPFYLSYALVPLLCGMPPLPALVRGAGVTFGAAAAWLAQLWLWPEENRKLGAGLTELFVGADGHAYSGDSGLGIYRLAAFAFDDASAALAASLVVGAGFAVLWYVINRRNAGARNSNVMASLGALAVAIFVNPRLKVYDDGIMTALLFGYFYLATNALRDRRAQWTFWVYVAAGSAFCLIKTAVKSSPTDFLADGFLVHYPVVVITALAWLNNGRGKEKGPDVVHRGQGFLA